MNLEPNMRTCAIEGCEKEHHCRGWCVMHYARYRRHGDPLVVKWSQRGDEEKTCSGCEQTKPVSAFYPRTEYPGLYRSRCKECMRADRQRWYENGGAEVKAAYTRAHPEMVARCSRRYYEANRAYYNDHAKRRRALVAGAGAESFSSKEIYERDGWICGICWQPVDPALSHPDPHSASIDHVIALARGGTHTRANVQLAHLVCNRRKQVAPPERLPLAA